MFNVCYACGRYRADKHIEAVGEPGLADVRCPECGRRHRFRRLPLLVLSGASGAGKGTVCQQFNRWFQTRPVIDLWDTTTLCVAGRVARGAAWIDAALNQHCDEKP